MKNEKRTLLKVGLTVIISILIVLFGIAFLKDAKFSLETNDLVVYFADVNGLKEGDPVSVNGVSKGKVRRIELAPGDSVRVEFFLAKDVVLKRDYSVSIAMIELMSGKQVFIKPGISPEAADISKPLVGARSNDVVSLVSTMNQVGENIRNIAVTMDTAVKNLDRTIVNINEITGDEGLKSNIRSTASNFNNASHSLNLMIAETRNSINSLTVRLNTVASNLDNTVTETKPELKQTIDDIRSLTAKVDTLAVNLNLFVLSAADTNSTVGKLLGEDKMYDDLNKTILSINKLVKKIEKDGIRLRLF